MTLAVIQTGGKQYLVAPGQKVKVEKLDVKEGATVQFPEVLLLNDDSATAIGTPFIAKAEVAGKVLRHGKHVKIFGAKVKSKKRNKKLFGHRQQFTEIEITKVVAK